MVGKRGGVVKYTFYEATALSKANLIQNSYTIYICALSDTHLVTCCYASDMCAVAVIIRHESIETPAHDSSTTEDNMFGEDTTVHYVNISTRAKQVVGIGVGVV